MTEWPYSYNICPENDPELFKKYCRIIEETYPEAEKLDLIVDVDGATYQRYLLRGKEIVVVDNYDIGAVWIDSEIDLRNIINSE